MNHYVFLTLFLLGLNVSDIPKFDNTQNKDLIVFEISVSDILKSESISFENDFTNLKFIPLETKPECMISSVEKITYYKKQYYVLTEAGNGRLFVFNDKGGFISKIGSQGNGPGEYVELSDFSISDILRYGDNDILARIKYDTKNYFVLLDLKNHNTTIFNTREKQFGDKLHFSFPISCNHDKGLISYYLANHLIDIDLKQRPYVVIENDYPIDENSNPGIVVYSLKKSK